MRLIGMTFTALTVLAQFNPPLWGTLSLLEAVWIVVNGQGFIYSRLNWKDADDSLEAAEEEPRDDVAVDVALLSKLIQTVIMSVQGVFFVLGLIAAISPPSSNQTLATLVITFGFIGVALGMDYLSYEVRRRRRLVFKKLVTGTTARNEVRDLARDEGRDLIRDEARDVARDQEHDAQLISESEGDKENDNQ